MHSNIPENSEILDDSSPKIQIDEQAYEEIEIEKNEPKYEDVNDPIIENRPQFSLQTDLCNDDDNDDVVEEEETVKSSVKDRMFLATDNTSCLLFTQTVTSPMLTPSEENIDFLKGFRRESPPTSTENTNGSPKLENELVEECNTASEVDGDISASEIIVTDIDNVAQHENKIYENAEFLKDNTTTAQNLYENIKSNGEAIMNDDEPIYENVEDIKKINRQSIIDDNKEIRNGNDVTDDDEVIYQNIQDVRLEENQTVTSKSSIIMERTSEFLKCEIESEQQNVIAVATEVTVVQREPFAVDEAVVKEIKDKESVEEMILEKRLKSLPPPSIH